MRSLNETPRLFLTIINILFISEHERNSFSINTLPIKPEKKKPRKNSFHQGKFLPVAPVIRMSRLAKNWGIEGSDEDMAETCPVKQNK